MKHTLLLSALLFLGCAAQPDISGPASAVPDFDVAAMDTLLSGAVERGEQVGVSALVFDEGHIVYSGAFGLRDKERNLPVNLESVFRIYSMTKPITSAVIMDLQEEGLLNVNDPAAKYIPELAQMMVISAGEDGTPVFAPQDPPMTIKDLMLHRSGIAYGIFGPVNPVEVAYEKAGLFDPSEDLSIKMTKLSKLPLLAQPGDGWYYSYSIDVLGRIAEIVTEKSLGEIMQDRIFEPLGMSHTGFYVKPEQAANFVSNYTRLEDGSFVLQDDAQTSSYLIDNAYQSGGGGLVSTLGDFAKFAQMLLDGGIYDGKRVLNEDTVRTMMTNQMDPDDKFMMPWFGDPGHAGFGYGGRVVLHTDPETVALTGESEGQYGWGGLAHTKFWIDKPNDAFGIIMLQYFGEEPPLHKSFQSFVLEQTKDSE